MFINNQGNYLNKSETEVELEILFMASPIRPEMVKLLYFLHFLFFDIINRICYNQIFNN